MNKFQFGTIMPQTRPVAFQYKPLGLEAFAAPLAMKQQRFDQTFAAIDKADFGIKGLPYDSIESKKLSDELTGYKNELLGNLDKTGNFREAARKLRELNKIYNKDPEITGIRKQAASFKEADKRERERIDGVKFTQDNYEKWRFKTLNEYKEKGGYNYDRSTGSHNTINVDARGDNLEKEIMDKSVELAKSTPLQINEILSTAGFGGLDANEIDFIKTKIKERKYGQVAEELAKHMRQSDRYNNYIEEKAEYDYYYDSRHDPNFRDNVVKNTYNKLEELIKVNEDFSKNPNASSTEKEQASKNADYYTQQINGYIESERKSKEEGWYDNFAKNSYIQNAKNTFLPSVAGSASDLFDVLQITKNIDKAGGSGGSKAAKKTEEAEDLILQVQALTANRNFTPSTGGTGSGAAKIQEDFTPKHYGNQFEFLKDLENAKKNTEEDGLAKTGIDKFESSPNTNIEGLNTFKQLYSNTQDWHSTSDRANKYNEEIEKMDLAIQSKKKDLNDSTLTYREKLELRREISTLNRDRDNAGENKAADFYLLNTLIDKEMNVEGSEWIKKAFEQGGYDEVYKQAYDKNLNSMSTIAGTAVAEIYSDRSPTSGLVNPHIVTYTDTEGNAQTTAMGNVEYQQFLETGINSKGLQLTNNLENITAEVGSSAVDAFNEQWKKENISSLEQENTLGNVMSDFKNMLNIRQSAIPREVAIDDVANKFTNNQLKRLTDSIKENPQGSAAAPTPVQFDAGTGTVEKDPNIKYDIKDFGRPSYVGTAIDEGANQVIFRYTRPELDKKEIAKRVLEERGESATATAVKTINNNLIEQWKNENPREIYLMQEGNSLDINDAAARTFTDLGKSALKTQSTYAFDNVLGGFAAINLISDNRRRKDYLEMASTLGKALKDKNSDMRIVQTPAYTQFDNNTGTYSGYEVEYKYDEDANGIVANIFKVTGGENIEGYNKQLYQQKRIQNLNDQAIRKMDIIYGVGDTRDVVIDPVTNAPFIPAFLSSSVNN